LLSLYCAVDPYIALSILILRCRSLYFTVAILILRCRSLYCSVDPNIALSILILRRSCLYIALSLSLCCTVAILILLGRYPCITLSLITLSLSLYIEVTCFLASHLNTPRSIRGHSAWHFWWPLWQCDRFISKYFGLSLSVSFHHCYTLIVSSLTLTLFNRNSQHL